LKAFDAFINALYETSCAQYVQLNVIECIRCIYKCAFWNNMCTRSAIECNWKHSMHS